REQEALAAGVDEAAHQVFAVRERDGVDEDVDGAEPLLRLREDGIDLLVAGHVALFDEIRTETFSERPNALFERRPGIGEAEGGSFAVEGLCDAPRDGVVVRYTEDERLLTVEVSHGGECTALMNCGTRAHAPS